MTMTHDFVSAKFPQLQQQVNQLRGIVSDALEKHTPIQEVALQTFDVLLQMGRSTLGILFDELGRGDVGESVEVEGKKQTE